MSSLALMRWLEAAPDRYDVGMRWLTLGRADALRKAIAEAATPSPGVSVLEVGCGTGAVTALLVARGARVTALDQNPEMMERARRRLDDAPDGAVTWLERTASEIEGMGEGCFDAVVASFSLSEMSASERAYVLRAARRALAPDGVLAVSDEVVPLRSWQRAIFAVLRAPQAALGWLLAGRLSRPIRNLAEEIRGADMEVVREERWLCGSLAVLVARPEGGTGR